MRDCLMMRDMARAYEGLIMTNTEKARATGDQNKIKDAEELDNLGGIPNCWADDLVLLKTELEELKELKDENIR